MVIFYRGLGLIFLIPFVLAFVLCGSAGIDDSRIILTIGTLGALGIQALVVRDGLWENHLMFVPLPVVSLLVVIAYLQIMVSGALTPDKYLGNIRNTRKAAKANAAENVRIVENIRFPSA